MSKIYPIFVKRTISGGGGTGNLALGPSYGQSAGTDDSTFNLGVNLDLLSIDVVNTKTIGTTITMPTLALANTKTIGVGMSGGLGYANTKTIGVGMSGGLAYESTNTSGTNATLSALGLENTETVGAHLSGSVLGAPFWQAVETVTLTVSVSSVVINKPSGTVSGDLLLAFFTTQLASGPMTAPSGWTTIYHDQKSPGTLTCNASLFYKLAGGSEPSSYTFNFTTNRNIGTCEMHRINGVDQTTPINVNAIATLNATTLVPDPVSPTVTTTAANCLVFCFLSHYHAALSQTHTPAASHTERADFQSGTSVIVGEHSMTRVFSATGATGTATHDCTETAATDAVMIRVAVAPGSLVIAT